MSKTSWPVLYIKQINETGQDPIGQTVSKVREVDAYFLPRRRVRPDNDFWLSGRIVGIFKTYISSIRPDKKKSREKIRVSGLKKPNIRYLVKFEKALSSGRIFGPTLPRSLTL